MQENFFKRNPQDGAVGRLKQRARVNREGPRFVSATRQPAWAKVVATGGSCGKTHKFSISSGSDKFNERHDSKFKHEPTLDKVNLIYGGDYGMNIELEIQITAHNREDFNQIEKALLVPGSKITLSFGYTSNIDPSVQGGYLPSKTEKGFRTVSFAFSTTANGAYVCTCKASAPAQWMRTIETKVSLPNKMNVGQYIITGWAGGTSKADVVGMPELLAYDAQSNGEDSIDEWDEGKTFTIGKRGHVVVYAGNTVDQNNWFNRTVKYFTTYGDEADSENTRNKVYYTLGYVIDRLVNGVILQNAIESASKKDKVDMLNLKVTLPEKQFSVIPNHISSGDPTRILFLGDGYAKFRAKGEETVDFYELAENKSAVRAAKWLDGDKASQITHSKILIAKSVLEEALKDSTAEKMEEKDSDKDSVKGTDSKEISLEQFLNNIFSTIKEVCGGAINLGLTVDPNDETKSTLRVVDRNYGRSEPLEIIVLNPIDSDGVTRECSIKSNVGSQQYQAYMFTGGSGEKDAVTHLRDCQGSDNDSGEREALYYKAVTNIEELAGLENGKGTLLKSGFASAQSESLIAAFKVIYNNVDVVQGDHKRKFRMMPYMGMELSATLDGIWGLVPGNGLFTTQVPFKYHQNGAYFNIRSVEHTIENSDWSTSVSGILTYHPKNELELIRL